MRILGIDPGTATTGWGVIEFDSDAPKEVYGLIGCGLVETKKETENGQRLDQIYQGIAGIIKTHQPDVVVVERLFFAVNALTAIAVGQAIGVIKLAIHHGHLQPIEYTPMQIKLVIGGSGKADKKMMKTAIKKLFKIREKKGMRTHFDNTADALAIAVCHARKIQGKIKA